MSGKPLKNPRHEAFARHYVRLGIARHAYVAAGYNARLPDDLSEHGPADTAAWRLLQHVAVKPRIERLREAMGNRANVTEESILDELEEARQVANKEGQSAAMVSASVAKAKLVGLMVDRKEIGDAGEFKSMSEQQLRDYIANGSNGQEEQQPKAYPAPLPTHEPPQGRQ